MLNAIEAGSAKLKEIEDVRRLSREIFNVAKELLGIRGEPKRAGIMQKKITMRHIATSCKPEVSVEIWCAGTDLQKAKRINMSVSGEEYALEVTRGKTKNEEVFNAKRKRYDGAIFPLELIHAHSFLNALRQIKDDNKGRCARSS